MMGSFIVPRRLASRGRMSKMSTPSILPRISRRSIPVACSRSVGTVPGAAPGPKRSSSVRTSAHASLSAIVVRQITIRRPRLRGAIEAVGGGIVEQHTLQSLVGANLLLGAASKSSGLLVGGGRTGSISCSGSKNTSQPSYDDRHWLAGGAKWKCVRRTKEVVKVRATAGRAATRRAAVRAERCRNILLMVCAGQWGRALRMTRDGLREVLSRDL